MPLYFQPVVQLGRAQPILPLLLLGSQISPCGNDAMAIDWRRSPTSSVFIVRPPVNHCLEFLVFGVMPLHHKRQVMTHSGTMNVSINGEYPSLCHREMHVSQREAVVRETEKYPNERGCRGSLSLTSCTAASLAHIDSVLEARP